MLLSNLLSLQIVFLVLRVGMDRNKVWKNVGDAASKYRENQSYRVWTSEISLSCSDSWLVVLFGLVQ